MITVNTPPASSLSYETIDGNTAAAEVAFRLSEVIAIYPITPSSTMGEIADALAAEGQRNIWGHTPSVTEMQSEGGAAGAVHGALTTGALTTTFTASQGLLLMIPNMFKIAGELTPAVFHVTARAIATQGLSIFGDHSDIMAARSTGWCMLGSGSVQEVGDMAAIAHAATLEARLPFIHFFDGFRTSHEVQKVATLSDDDLRWLISEEAVFAHRQRGLSPDRPVIRGTAQNPDVYFQGRETCNPYYQRTPEIVQRTMDHLAERTGRQYRLFDYHGSPDAERVVIAMGSACETLTEVVDHLNSQGEKVGLVTVRLFRPFSVSHLIAALPASVKRIGVLDRTKEPGAAGEPLYQDVQTAVMEQMNNGGFSQGMPRVYGGRYGLGSKEFNAAMAKAVFDNLSEEQPRNHFVVGIIDDLTDNWLRWDHQFSCEADGVHRALFYGLGADGTVGANKNSIKIIGDGTDYHCQGYFVYDSKKSGSMTVSHLRFSPQPIRSTYLIEKADFVACHSFPFLTRYPMIDSLREGGVFLLNAPNTGNAIWQDLPRKVQEQLIQKKARFFAIDAYALGKEIGLGGRINVIMQACFFAISGVLPQDQALRMIEDAVKKTYGSKGPKVVEMNIRAARAAAERLVEVPLGEAASAIGMCMAVPADAPEFVQTVTAAMIKGEGDSLPVSAIPDDGTWPTGTTRFEKRAIGLEVPIWDPDTCIQCNLCSFVCPHATIRPKVYDATQASGACPDGWRSTNPKGRGMDGLAYTLQVAAEDCTGCGACVHVCPAMEKDADKQPTGRKAINMTPFDEVREREIPNWSYFVELEGLRPESISVATPKGSQLMDPLFEFSGACGGCGETPYVKLVSQLFGDRALIANATGCSSIYGGNLPTTPWASNRQGRGPAWSNSLFEDNAEFGLGMRLSQDQFTRMAQEALSDCDCISAELQHALLAPADTSESGIAERRRLVEELKQQLISCDNPHCQHLLSLADNLVPRSMWIMGGDGWAYDIGFGGLDHVLASGANVNVLVLDTGVYSNTGGQSSKSTPRAAVAKFAASGKDAPRKDLGASFIAYGGIYVAQIAYGANPAQTVKAIQEAEAFPGPSIIIAYSHCIAHGIDMRTATDLHKDAVNTGFWPLYRYDPRLREQGKTPLQIDSKEPSADIEQFTKRQGRFRILTQSDPQAAKILNGKLASDVRNRYQALKALANPL
ncbi:MAG: pyruvate:ferredoxin (flavodoxin) oxidoreductase [Planctomycetota bacterium]|nr:MAG: pyruvate:ferredoxin (flavodoxin) oxidoreductase [Planctomycetota bacterium]